MRDAVARVGYLLLLLGIIASLLAVLSTASRAGRAALVLPTAAGLR
jgi:hypothetical protein